MAPVPSVLDVLIIYEDLGTALRAKHSLDRLPTQAGTGPRLNTKLWKVDLLREPLLREQAAIEAIGVDVIILSIHGRSELPVAVREWLHRWLDRKEKRPYAFCVLLDPELAGRWQESPVAAQVKVVGEVSGVDLFFGFCEASSSELDAAISAIRERTHRSMPMHGEMLKRPQRHRWWGINE